MPAGGWEAAVFCEFNHNRIGGIDWHDKSRAVYNLIILIILRSFPLSTLIAPILASPPPRCLPSVLHCSTRLPHPYACRAQACAVHTLSFPK